MSMPFRCLAVALLAAAGWPEHGFAQPAERWQTIDVVQDKDIAVHLKVVRQASLADAGWLFLEFTNTGKRPLIVREAHYRMERHCDDPQTGKLVNSGGLASGNSYDLFPDAWKTRPVAPIVLPGQSIHQVVDHPSDYSATLLGLPPRLGWRVRASIHLTLELEDGRRLETPQAGAAFAFDWRYPDQAGFTALRARLKRLLQQPENKVQHAYILDTLFKVPEVASVVTRDELLAGLRQRQGQGSFDGRDAVANCLADRHGDDPVVQAYYRERLQTGDSRALDDLRDPRLWQTNLVEPLARLFESNATKYQAALAILHQNRLDWVEDRQVVARLSAAVLKRSPLLHKPVADLRPEELEPWAWGVASLAQTGDRAAIERLRPALQDRRTIRSTALMAFAAFPAGRQVPPLRACDCALDAILTLLDGSPDAAYRQARFDAVKGKPGPELDQAASAVRDRMITDLKQRLEAPDQASKSKR